MAKAQLHNVMIRSVLQIIAVWVSSNKSSKLWRGYMIIGS